MRLEMRRRKAGMETSGFFPELMYFWNKRLMLFILGVFLVLYCVGGGGLREGRRGKGSAEKRKARKPLTAYQRLY
jgi:hypothetical protein